MNPYLQAPKRQDRAKPAFNALMDPHRTVPQGGNSPSPTKAPALIGWPGDGGRSRVYRAGGAVSRNPDAGTAARAPQGATPVVRTAAKGPVNQDIVVPPKNKTGYWELGWQWATGEGPRHQVFTQNDPATQMLMKHDNFDRMRDWISRNGEGQVGKTLKWSHSLGGMKGILVYAGQYASLASNGHGGNLAATYLGSYRAEFTIKSIDKNGNAIVDVHVWNDSDLKSATHPPYVGYTRWWQKNVEPKIEAAQPKSGPLSPTRQDFYWQEMVKLNP